MVRDAGTVARKDGTVLADVLFADVAAAAFADAAFHAQLQRRKDLVLAEAHFRKRRQAQFDHDGRPAQADRLVRRKGQVLEERRHKAHMPRPAFFRTVNGKMYPYILMARPVLCQFAVFHKILFAARAVDDVDGAVVPAVVQHVVDDAAQGRHADAAADEEHILALQASLHGKMVAEGPAHGDFLPFRHVPVQKVREAARPLDAELQKGFVGRRRRNRKNRFAEARYGEEGALPGQVLEQFAAAGFFHLVGGDIGRFAGHLRNHAHDGNHTVLVAHSDPSFAVSASSAARARSTFTIFRFTGQAFRQRPQPTQAKVPSWSSGK